MKEDDIVIAEWMGWTHIVQHEHIVKHDGVEKSRSFGTVGYEPGRYDVDNHRRKIPKYSGSLESMANAERYVDKLDLRDEYMECLAASVFVEKHLDEDGVVMHEVTVSMSEWDIATATAGERSRALVEMLGDL